jgi:hypothetical protein
MEQIQFQYYAQMATKFLMRDLIQHAPLRLSFPKKGRIHGTQTTTNNKNVLVEVLGDQRQVRGLLQLQVREAHADDLLQLVQDRH